MGKYIAVQGCELSLVPPCDTAVVTIVTSPSTKVKADSKGCYKGSISISIATYNGGLIDVTGSGNGTGNLKGTASKVKIENEAAVLEGDTCVIDVKGLKVAGTSTVSVTQPVTVTIKKAGQTKAKAT